MTCATCGGPMADDQRYCMTCGARGAEARLPFLDVLRPADAHPVPRNGVLPAMSYAVALPPGPLSVADRLRANSGLLAGLAVLLLALLVGVAIGAGLNDSSPQAAAPPATQVIRLEGTGAAAPAATAATAPATTTSTTDATPAKAKAKKAKAKASATARKATNPAVKNLSKLTGAAAVKAADKLGKTVVVGGKAPKKDKKPAAGGGTFQDIG